MRLKKSGDNEAIRVATEALDAIVTQQEAYTTTLKNMAKAGLREQAASLGGEGNLEAELAYIEKNTVMARSLVQGDIDGDTEAQLHPGFWGSLCCPQVQQVRSVV